MKDAKSFFFFFENIIVLQFTLRILKAVENTKQAGFAGGSDGKESTCKAEHPGSIPGWGGSPGEGNGNPIQDSCLGDPMDRGAWRAAVHGISKIRTRLSD